MIRAARHPLAGSLALGALFASLAVSPAAWAGATYPPGPGNCCPDTLTIINLRNPAAVPHPTNGDVVLGVGGIVTAFAPHFGPYGFYMQMSNGLPYSGVAVFTGNVDHGPGTLDNLQIGDSVVVYGKVQHFSGTDPNLNDVVIGSLDGGDNVLMPDALAPAQGNVLVRRVSRGNPLPPAHLGSLADFGPDSPRGGPWAAMLVQLPGPLVVVNPSLGASTGPSVSESSTFLVADPGCTANCDQVMVDGGYLTDVPPPPAGTLIGLVQGIFDRYQGDERILLRSPDDLVLGAPPHASDAFPIYDNDQPGPARIDSIMVVFDRPVEKASAEDVANYALASHGAIDGAHRLDAPADDRVVLKIRNGLDDGALEGITVDHVKSLDPGTPMFTPNTLQFFNGVLEPEVVDVPDAAALAGNPCDDRSRFSGPGASAGKRASFTGTVTGAFGDLYALQGAAPARAGLWVSSPDVALVPGRAYLLAGALHEVMGETQGTHLVYVRDLGPGASVASTVRSIRVLSDDTCDNAQLFLNGQDLEGMRVTADRAVIVASAPAGGDFTIAIPSAGSTTALKSAGTLASGPQDQILVVGAPGFTPIAGRIVTVTGALGRVSGTLAIYPPDASSIHDYGPAPTFTLPLNVSKAATASRDPDIVRGVNAELFMVWDRVFHESVHSLSLDDAQNWSSALPILHQGIMPAAAVTPSNKFGVISATTDGLLFKQSIDNGFQMDPLVTTVDGLPARFPALTVGSGEHFHAAWERTGTGIYCARSLTGGLSFDNPVPLALNGDTDTNSMARICATTGDQVFVFWQYDQPGEPGVHKVLYRRSLDGGASFYPARLVRDESNPLTSVVKLAYLGDAQTGPDGTVYVMGLQQGGPADSVAFLKSTNQGLTFALVGHLPNPAPTGLCPKSFTVGADGSIHALVAICGTTLFYTRSTDGGGTWTAPVDVSSAQSSEVGEPRGAKIILDGTGAPVIVWYAPVGSSTEIYSTRLLN